MKNLKYCRDKIEKNRYLEHRIKVGMQLIRYTLVLKAYDLKVNGKDIWASSVIPILTKC